MPRKRAPSVHLTAHPSPHNSSVTLFEASSVAEVASDTSVRRPKRVKLNPDMSIDIEDTSLSAGTSKTKLDIPSTHVSENVKTVKRKPSSSPSKAKPIRTALDVPHPAPPRWRETYDAIKSMKEKIVAPVDTMGCAQASLKEIDPKSQRLSTLVSLMLSSQTKDEVTFAAVDQLREALGGSITLEALIAADESLISESICKVGFWRRKAGYIKQAAIKLRDEFDSDIPNTVVGLCSLTGVGPKMAFLTMQSAWNLNVGIGVDVHVHRITNRLGWHKPPTKNPEETRLNLQSWLPTELHPEINPLLVGFGQMICVPVGPKCNQCTLSASGLCPSAKLKPTKVKKVVKVKKTVSIDVGAVADELSELSELSDISDAEDDVGS